MVNWPWVMIHEWSRRRTVRVRSGLDLYDLWIPALFLGHSVYTTKQGHAKPKPWCPPFFFFLGNLGLGILQPLHNNQLTGFLPQYIIGLTGHECRTRDQQYRTGSDLLSTAAALCSLQTLSPVCVSPENVTGYSAFRNHRHVNDWLLDDFLSSESRGPMSVGKVSWYIDHPHFLPPTSPSRRPPPPYSAMQMLLICLMCFYSGSSASRSARDWDEGSGQGVSQSIDSVAASNEAGACNAQLMCCLFF